LATNKAHCWFIDVWSGEKKRKKKLIAGLLTEEIKKTNNYNTIGNKYNSHSQRCIRQ
jgi:hypothetical protein